MANDSTTDDSNSTTTDADDFDLSAEDNVGNDSSATTDDDQGNDEGAGNAGNDDDNQASNNDSVDNKPKTDDKKTPAFDPDLDQWAEKTGHEKPENDRERKLLQDLRNSKREFTSKREAKKAAEALASTIKDSSKDSSKTDDDLAVDPLEKEVKEMRGELNAERATRLQSEYISENNVTDEEVAVMGEILKEEAEKDPDSFKYLSDPRRMDKLHALVKQRMAAAGQDTSEVVEKAKKEERERLAKISKSGAPNQSAKGTVNGSKKDPIKDIWDDDSI